jgi:hypothetical protein
MNVEYLGASSLVLMGDLYPRESMSIEHVRALADAIEAGADLPPLLVDDQTRRIVDGQHRYHAFRRVFGDDCEIPCALKRYSSDAEMFADAVLENAKHGLRFTSKDHVQVTHLAASLQITPDDLRPLLMVSTETLRWAKIRDLGSPGAAPKRRGRAGGARSPRGPIEKEPSTPATVIPQAASAPRAFEPKDKLGRAQHCAQNLSLLLENQLVDQSYKELVRDLARLKLAINAYLARAQERGS